MDFSLLHSIIMVLLSFFSVLFLFLFIVVHSMHMIVHVHVHGNSDT